MNKKGIALLGTEIGGWIIGLIVVAIVIFAIIMLLKETGDLEFGFGLF